jgi:hypothetical protein
MNKLNMQEYYVKVFPTVRYIVIYPEVSLSGLVMTTPLIGAVHHKPHLVIGSYVHSWEPEGNVKQCIRLLDSFWRHIGTDNADCHVGDEFNASPEWISGSVSHSPYMLY